MRSILLLLTIIIAQHCFCQSRMILNNNVQLVFNNNAYLVIDNSNANAISTTGSGGNIISESEFNIIKWNIGATTGSYIIPFSTTTGIKIPLNLTITSGATGSGNIQFSTYASSTWDNNVYKPTGVTNMTNIATLNNSAEVIDRFWLLNAAGYTTKPGGDIEFTYNDAEHLAAGNTITESDLKAERYDDASNSWELYPVGGVVNTITNLISSVPFVASDFSRVWSLIDQTSHLLPILLTAFHVDCMMQTTVITWTTAQEVNTDYFILEGSADGENFYPLATIHAAGNSNIETNYSFTMVNGGATSC